MLHPLICAEALDTALAGAVPPQVLDCRARLDDAEAGRRLWRQGHIASAQHVSLDDELAAEPGSRGRHPLPDAEAFTAVVQRLGIKPDVPVVVYDDCSGRLAAARAWWMLAIWAGHPDVRVLDGGLDAWQQRGGALVTATAAPVPSDWRPRFNDAAWIDADTVAGGKVLPVDARAAPRFRGESEPMETVAGHIPGAVNRPSTDNLTADGGFKAPAVLNAELPRAPAIAVYCGSGVSACHHVLAYAVAGRALPRLYVGSWSEWITDATRGVATGD
ncbi:sulfurtransferase [Halomonas cibimaris]|uniref:Sulfurtransferase n=1 Tax=Halomonas cibimaris TaxID=657012 RepID=A0ABP7LNK6_9GAMM